MRLLIDGYNLLYAIGFGHIGTPKANLEASRRELLEFLAKTLSATKRRKTVIVFDAQQSPPGASHSEEFAGMQIRFAAEYLDADELIEELIRAHHTPRRLLVVSSDHRIQVAAQRRKAQVIDSEKWYEQLTDPRLPPRARPQQAEEDPGEKEVPDMDNPFPPDYLRDIDVKPNPWHPFPPGHGEE